MSRIISAETEYGAMFCRDVVKTDPNYGDEWIERCDADLNSLGFNIPQHRLADMLPSQMAGQVNQHLLNGGKLYLDIGAHPEYAAPEDVNLDGLVANDIAGDDIVYGAMQGVVARQWESAPDLSKRFSINRRVLGKDGTAWGRHDNLSFDRAFHKSVPMMRLVPQVLALRSLYAGAGGLLPNGKYTIAQKIPTIQILSGTSTTTKRPLLNMRDEPHADPARYSRLHVACGDAPMSPWAVRMGSGVLALTLDLIESKRVPEHLYMPDHEVLRMAHLVASDFTMKKTVRLETGQTITPVDLHLELASAFHDMVTEQDYPPDDDMVWVAAELRRALNGLKQDPLALRDRADWPLHIEIIQNRRDKLKGAVKDSIILGTPGHDQLSQADHLWDTLHPIGIGRRLRNTLWRKWWDPSLAQERRTTPPGYTRAVIRGNAVCHVLAEHPLEDKVAIDWMTLNMPCGHVKLPDPFAVTVNAKQIYKNRKSSDPCPLQDVLNMTSKPRITQ